MIERKPLNVGSRCETIPRKKVVAPVRSPGEEGEDQLRDYVAAI